MNLATLPNGAMLCALSCLTACASPREHLYTLENHTAPTLSHKHPQVVILGPLTVPDEVDRPQIVVHEGLNRVVINEQERWIVPLKVALPRVLSYEMTARSENTHFVPMAILATTKPKGRLAVDVMRFEVNRDQGVNVLVHWMYRSSDVNSDPIEGDATSQRSITDFGYVGIVEALHESCIQVADEIADRLVISPD